MGVEERYDPEDIEQLMTEKAFNDLLEDERRFVLKHVSDEVEYERIRSTMFRIQDDIKDEGSISPDPGMRRELIASFKEHRRTNYRYWLNSIMLFLFPQSGHAFWAPAIRLASIALLIGACWFAIDSWNSMVERQQLAEVSKNDDEPKEEISTKDLSNAEEPSESAPAGTDEESDNAVQKSLETESTADQLVTETNEALEDFKMDVASADEMMSDKEIFDLAEPAAGIAAEEAPSAPAIARFEDEGIPATDDVVISERRAASEEISQISTREMSVESLMRMKKGKQRPTKSRSLAEDSQLIGLLTQAW